jgi:phosphonate transport system ATP-binding protein
MNKPLLEVNNLSKSFGSSPVLEDISFQVRAGEFVAVLGPSGAGKTTLFRSLTRLVEPDNGSILLQGQAIATIKGHQLRLARRKIGLIFQQFNLIRRLSALDNVLVGRLAYVPTWRVMLRQFSRADRQLALACLDQVGLLEKAYQRADSLSGGQQQRVAIARVLAQQSELILADEPVASLDPASAELVLSTLREIAHQQGIAVLCSLHQVNLATGFADRIIGLRDGRIVADLPTIDFNLDEHSRIYQNGQKVLAD